VIEALAGPFAEFSFLRRALVGCVALSVSAPPLGLFLMLRRMSLTADVLSHGILPGVAVGFLLGGLSVLALAAGGFVGGLLVALGAGALARATGGREDAALAALYDEMKGRGAAGLRKAAWTACLSWAPSPTTRACAAPTWRGPAPSTPTPLSWMRYGPSRKGFSRNWE